MHELDATFDAKLKALNPAAKRTLQVGDRQIAIDVYRIALGQVVRLGDTFAAEAAVKALRLPSASTIRALIAAGHGREWLPSVVDALAEVGIAAAEDVLGDAVNQHPECDDRSEPRQ